MRAAAVDAKRGIIYHMTRRRDEMCLRFFNQLMHSAGDRIEADAIKALGEYQKIMDAGGTSQNQRILHHAWVVTDLNKIR
jgi:hypothetical protein